MFYGAYFYSVFVEYRTSCGFCYVFSYSIDDGLAFHIGALNLITVIIRSRVEGYCKV